MRRAGALQTPCHAPPRRAPTPSARAPSPSVPQDGHYGLAALSAIFLFGWALLLLTLVNCTVWVYVHYFTVLQHGWVVRKGAAPNWQLYSSALYTFALALMALLGVSCSPFWFALHLLMIVQKSTMLHIVLRSVFLNGWSLLATFLLTVVVVYLFIIFGYVFFPQDFVGSGSSAGVCGTLLDCFAFGLFNGLRAGGGLGDLLPQRVSSFRLLFDFAFFLIIVCPSHVCEQGGVGMEYRLRSHTPSAHIPTTCCLGLGGSGSLHPVSSSEAESEGNCVSDCSSDF